MRSPLGPVLAIVGVAMTIALVLVLLQTIGLRGDLEALRASVDAVGAEVAAQEPGVNVDELERHLDELESGIRDWLIATGADGFDPDASPAAQGSANGDVLAGIDEILERVDALDARLDQICEGVPIC